MQTFNFYVPTEIRFGAGRISETADIISSLGKRCLLVTRPESRALGPVYEKIKKDLKLKKINVFHFEGVVLNPTIESVKEGIRYAQLHQVDCVLVIGGGSAIDTAKLIALFYSFGAGLNPGTVFQNYSDPFKIYNTPVKNLPLVAITTTSGTGAHVTQAAVVTDALKQEKGTVFHQKNFPLLSIVDPELMLTVPEKATAATGFDTFTHAFESFLGKHVSPLTEMMCLEAISLVVKNLPQAINEPSNIEYRKNLAWADTLAGMCLANGGADIPHTLGEIIGGICPRIAHGETLAIVYPEFLKFKKDKAIEKFSKIAIAMNSKLIAFSQELAAGLLYKEVSSLLQQIDLSVSMANYGISKSEFQKICESPVLNDLGFFASKQELLNILTASRSSKIQKSHA